MTKPQLQLIHVARRQVEKLSGGAFDDAAYRLLLWNIARARSSTQLSNTGLEEVMAFFESRGFVDSHNGEGYWQRKVDERDRFANQRLIQKIHALIPQTTYKLEGLCLRFSNGRTDQVQKLDPREAYNLIEMLKAVAERNQALLRSQLAEAT